MIWDLPARLSRKRGKRYQTERECQVARRAREKESAWTADVCSLWSWTG